MKRRGFTIIELLIVITVIGILMAMVMAASGVLISHARHSATETTIKKINALIVDRQHAMHRFTLRPGWLRSSPYWAYACELTTDTNLRPIIAKKIAERVFFPQNRDDLFSPNQAIDDQLALLYGELRSEPRISNEEILFATLTSSSVISDSIRADIFSTSEIGTGPNGLPTFKDAWGQSLQFYRWPTRLALTAPESMNVPWLSVNRDPDDPLGRCSNYPNFRNEFHDPAIFHLPIVVSAGPDTYFGLGDPNNNALPDRLCRVIDSDLATDNIIKVRIP